MVGETLCLTCIRDTPSLVWEIPPLIVEVDLKVTAGFPTSIKDGFNATLANIKSTLYLLFLKKLNGSIIRCRDAGVAGLPIISSVILQLHGEIFVSKHKLRLDIVDY